jgi:hypothetical protein
MLSFEHELLVEILRDHSEAVVELLRAVLEVEGRHVRRARGA